MQLNIWRLKTHPVNPTSQPPTHQPRIHQMVGLEKLSRLIRDLHYEWSFEVRNVNIEKTFGWIGASDSILGLQITDHLDLR